MSQFWLRIQNIWRRGAHLWPLDRVQELSQGLDFTISVPREKVFELAKVQDDFTCPECGSTVETQNVTVDELFPEVVQSIRHGQCEKCGGRVQFENRFYRGNIAAKHAGQWIVLIVRPSILERFWYRLTRSLCAMGKTR